MFHISNVISRMSNNVLHLSQSSSVRQAASYLTGSGPEIKLILNNLIIHWCLKSVKRGFARAIASALPSKCSRRLASLSCWCDLKWLEMAETAEMAGICWNRLE